MNLEDEIKLEDHKHSKAKTRLYIDKGLLVLVFGILALLSKCVLEDYKSDLIRQQFIIESRIKAIEQINEEYSTLQNDLHWLVAGDKDDRENIIGRYQADMHKFLKVVNKSIPLFSEKFDQLMTRHFWIHQAIAEGAEFDSSHWLFAIDVFKDFDRATRDALWEEALDTPFQTQPNQFQLLDLPQGAAAMDVHEYYQLNLEMWKKLNPVPSKSP